MSGRVPICVYDLIGDFAFGMPYSQLKEELNVCDAIQKAVPPAFLKPYAWYFKGNWGFPNNPLRRGNAFRPITNMDLKEPWGHVPIVVCNLLCKRKVRKLKTYRKIFFRRVGNMLRHGLFGWNAAYEKSLRLIRPEHFKSRASASLVQGVCEQLLEASPIPLEVLHSKSLLRASRLFGGAL